MLGTKRMLSAAALCAAAGLAGVAPAQSVNISEYGTGFVPVGEETYNAFPKVQRFRAFFGDSRDLSDRFPAPGHQYSQGSCAAWAVGYAARSFLLSGETGERVPQGQEMSPAYIYNSTSTDPSCRRGVTLSAALKLVSTEGVASLAEFPYNKDQCLMRPTAGLRASAAKHKLYSWRAVAHKTAAGQTTSDWREPLVIDDIKGELWKGNPIVFGMRLPQDFFLLGNHKGDYVGVYRSDQRWDRSSAPPPGGAQHAMHAMALVGYDNSRQAFKVMNSWGQGWGEKGYLWIDYQTFQNLVGEAYVLEPARLASPPPPKPEPGLTVDQRLRQATEGMVCARTNVVTRNGRRSIEGFAGSAEQIADLERRAGEIDSHAAVNVRHRPWPQCEAELTLERPLADPAAKLRLVRDGGPVDDDPLRFNENDMFSIEVETTAARPFMHVIYIQADGSAVELYRGQPQPDAKGQRKLTVGNSGAKDVRFQVASPFGDEVVIAVASDRPLFGGRLDDYRTEREFLSNLKSTLVQADRAKRPVSAAVRRVRTTKAPAKA